MLFATGCTSSDELDGHADALSFAGVATQSYELRAEITVKLPSEIAAMTGPERDAEVVEHAERVHKEFGSVFYEALAPSWLEIKLDRRPFINVARQSRRTDLKMLGNSAYTMVATAEFVCTQDLLSKLRVAKDAGGTFLLVKNKEGRGADIVNEFVKVYIRPIETNLDVYPKYMDLFESGLDIAIHVGADYVDKYHPFKVDLPRARSVYDYLVSNGFGSSVPRFEDLKMDSPPLTKEIRVGDRDVLVRVRIFHALMATPETAGTLVEAFQQSAKNADVVIYDGHAGARELKLLFSLERGGQLHLPSAFKNFDLTERQQIYFLNGCDSFEYADAVYAHSKRSELNTDIVASFGTVWLLPEATPVINFIDGLLGGATKNRFWKPNTWSEILQRIGKDVDTHWQDVYGVAGIGDNSKANPLK